MVIHRISESERAGRREARLGSQRRADAKDQAENSEPEFDPATQTAFGSAMLAEMSSLNRIHQKGSAESPTVGHDFRTLQPPLSATRRSNILTPS
ncbi:MAG: hypothetical protein DMG04_14875 [Acidobacteria bacterium]|nr:MAG: hypothetical protein DMG04_14875 [Acidobacteriota bacterium]PYQ88980.1 MAG: hypothetical protein DMG03_02715 [Acidobacteriota bacterium]PYQ90563.1 MAG: hypothetical protein DMG02_09515 [Acidobacteriota bacterium]PYR04787.1 MAG: hypothetical protein DMF99_30695 [Acidobacteriota bacterium]